MNYRMLKRGEVTRITDERKISGPKEKEEWETSLLGASSTVVPVDGLYRRPCDDDTWRLFKACEVIMEFARKNCLEPFFGGPLKTLYRIQEDNIPSYLNREDQP